MTGHTPQKLPAKAAISCIIAYTRRLPPHVLSYGTTNLPDCQGKFYTFLNLIVGGVARTTHLSAETNRKRNLLPPAKENVNTAALQTKQGRCPTPGAQSRRSVTLLRQSKFFHLRQVLGQNAQGLLVRAVPGPSVHLLGGNQPGMKQAADVPAHPTQVQLQLLGQLPGGHGPVQHGP